MDAKEGRTSNWDIKTAEFVFGSLDGVIEAANARETITRIR